jgi:hypothetical protein
VRSSAYGSRFRVQGLESGNVDPMRATKGNENETTIARDENNEDTRRVSVMESKRRRFT